MVLGIIGVGAIASAIVTGLCAESPEGETILLSPRNPQRAAALAAAFPRVRVAATSQAVLDGADTVLLCLRPQDAPEALDGLHFAPRHAVVSAMAGLSLAWLRDRLGPVQSIARTIPLPAAARRRSTTPVFPATEAAQALFGGLGTVIAVADEAAFEGFAAASSTVAAHFAALEAIAAWLAGKGTAAPAARAYVAALFAEAAAPLSGPEVDFAALAQEHATPGGLNELFRRHLDETGTYAAMAQGLDRVLARIAEAK